MGKNVAKRVVTGLRKRRQTKVALSGKPVGAVESAIKILRYLGDGSPDGGMTVIARTLSLNSSTTFNILRTLTREGLVDFDAESKKYSLGAGIIDLAKGATSKGVDLTAIRPNLEKFANTYGSTVAVWRCISEDRKVLVMDAISGSDIKIHVNVGYRLPIFAGAAGRVLAAFSNLPRAKLQKQFQELRWDRPITFDQYMKQVDEARSRGWAIDEGHFMTGVTSIAVPVLALDGTASISIVAMMFANQYTDTRSKRMLEDLREIRSALENRLNGVSD
jgi:DNA-binding IclR family transcriptional regulator